MVKKKNSSIHQILVFATTDAVGILKDLLFLLLTPSLVFYVPAGGGDQGESSGMVATIPISSKQYKLALDIIRVYYTPTSMDNF